MQTKLNNLISKLAGLNAEIEENPILFYGEKGKEAIILSKQIHTIGAEMLHSLGQRNIKITSIYPLVINHD